MKDFYFEDFNPGDTYKSPSHTVDADEIVTFGRKYDPQYYHLDAKAAEQSVFGGLVAGGFQTAALAWALALRTGMFDKCSMAGIAAEEMRWLRPLRVGDTIICEMEVLERKVSTSKPDRGAVTWRYDILNQAGERIFTMKLTQLMRRRPSL